MSNERDFQILKEMCEKYRNWGRFGPDDQVGTVNWITQEKVLQGIKSVKKGKIFSLAIPMDGNGPQTGGIRRFNPMVFMLRDGRDTAGGEMMGAPQNFGSADDVFMMPTHGATHWDALAHVYWDGKMWNGYDIRLVSSFGAQKNGIENYRDKIFGRGVLLDVARLKGMSCIDDGYAITAEDLDAAEKMANIKVERGDILLVRTGMTEKCLSSGKWGTYAGGDAPGLSIWTAEWLFNHEIAAVAMDTWGCEVRPNELDWGASQPWHRVVIPNMGLLMGELFRLDPLADECAEDGNYEFLVAAPPLTLTGAVGSPINPLAIK